MQSGKGNLWQTVEKGDPIGLIAGIGLEARRQIKLRLLQKPLTAEDILLGLGAVQVFGIECAVQHLSLLPIQTS